MWTWPGGFSPILKPAWDRVEMTFVLGLTGSVGMGKSTAVRILRAMKVPVFDADACVHELLGSRGAAVEEVEKTFPGTKNKMDGGINRKALGKIVFADPKALKKLEDILHPLVRQAEKDFIDGHRTTKTCLIVLDIPLLFETGAQDLCHGTIVVSASPEIQRARVLARPGMTEEKFHAMIAAQMPDTEKRARADWVIPTGSGRTRTWRDLNRLVTYLRKKSNSDHTTRNRSGYRDDGS